MALGHAIFVANEAETDLLRSCWWR